jgi:hypothetical protein
MRVMQHQTRNEHIGLRDFGRAVADVEDFVNPQTRCGGAGWTVIISREAVTVPIQSVIGKTSDGLRDCLAAAYDFAGIELTARVPGVATVSLSAVARTLSLGGHVAKRRWRRKGYDIYSCTGAAWRANGMVVPYVSLVEALRVALPPATTLIEYNDRATGSEQIHRLYTRAIGKLAVRSRPTVAEDQYRSAVVSAAHA